MKRLLVYLILSTVVAAGCGGNGTDPNSSTLDPANHPDLRYLGAWALEAKGRNVPLVLVLNASGGFRIMPALLTGRWRLDVGGVTLLPEQKLYPKPYAVYRLIAPGQKPQPIHLKLAITGQALEWRTPSGTRRFVRVGPKLVAKPSARK